MNSLKVLVFFTDLIWDNYQGGSGQVIHSKILVEIEGSIEASAIKEKAQTLLREHRKTFFRQCDEPVITKMEIL